VTVTSTWNNLDERAFCIATATPLTWNWTSCQLTQRSSRWLHRSKDVLTHTRLLLLMVTFDQQQCHTYSAWVAFSQPERQHYHKCCFWNVTVVQTLKRKPEAIQISSTLSYFEIRLYRISAPAPAGIRHFLQIRQKSSSGKNPTRAG